MERAEMEKEFKVPGYEDVTAGIVHWPLSVIRIRHKDPERLIDLADHILKNGATTLIQMHLSLSRQTENHIIQSHQSQEEEGKNTNSTSH